jgi:hypothetical protein
MTRACHHGKKYKNNIESYEICQVAKYLLCKLTIFLNIQSGPLSAKAITSHGKESKEHSCHPAGTVQKTIAPAEATSDDDDSKGKRADIDIE